MADLLTGPIGAGTYEALESECLSGTDLLNTRGEVGLAVSYDEQTVYRFLGRVMDVTPRSGVDLVHMDVVSLDDKMSYGFSMEADPKTGVIWKRSLQFRPMSDVNGPKPKKACLYDEEIAEKVYLEEREDRLTGRDAVAFRRLAENERQRAYGKLARAAAGSYGIIPRSIETPVPWRNPAPRHSRRLALIGGAILVPVPKGKRRS